MNSFKPASKKIAYQSFNFLIKSCYYWRLKKYPADHEPVLNLRQKKSHTNQSNSHSLKICNNGNLLTLEHHFKIIPLSADYIAIS